MIKKEPPIAYAMGGFILCKPREDIRRGYTAEAAQIGRLGGGCKVVTDGQYFIAFGRILPHFAGKRKPNLARRAAALDPFFEEEHARFLS